RLLPIADDVIDLVHAGESFRIDLRRAAGDDDLRAGPRAPRAPDGLPRLPHALAGHGASVDDHRLAEPGGARMLTHDFGFVGIEPAAEGDDLDIWHLAAY